MNPGLLFVHLHLLSTGYLFFILWAAATVFILRTGWGRSLPRTLGPLWATELLLLWIVLAASLSIWWFGTAWWRHASSVTWLGGLSATAILLLPPGIWFAIRLSRASPKLGICLALLVPLLLTALLVGSIFLVAGRHEASLAGNSMLGIWKGDVQRKHRAVPYTLTVDRASGTAFSGTAANPAGQFGIQGTVRGDTATAQGSFGSYFTGKVSDHTWTGILHRSAGTAARNWPFILRQVAQAAPPETAPPGGAGAHLPGVTARTVRLTVSGNSPWVDTGLYLQSGWVVRITASGTINNGSIYPRVAVNPPQGQGLVTAGGGCTAALTPQTGFPAPGLPCWSLIGRIGQGQIFGVGSALTLTADQPGELLLGVDNNAFRTSTGGWTVRIEVSHPA